MRLILLILIVALSFGLYGQDSKPIRLNLNDDGSRYVQFLATGQFWLRTMQLNPGSEVNSELRKTNTDFLMRRLRMVVYGQPTERLTFVTVLGGNNITFQNTPYTQLGLLDFSADYKITDWMALGGGKTAWHGLSRFSATPSSLNILAVDLPVFAMPTVMINDDLGRKLAVYARGQAGIFDYRVNVSRPFTPIAPDPGENAVFDRNNNTFRTSGYFKLQFRDKESNLLPFAAGSYYGSKDVLNIGIGFDYHPDAMIRLENNEAIQEDMILLAADVFYDAPLNRELNTAISIYGGFYHYDYGKNYIRNVGIGTPTIRGRGLSYNGAGNAYPMMGTGELLYGQAGYMLPNKWNNKVRKWQAQIVGAVQMAKYQLLDDAMVWYDVGFNIHIDNFSKLSFGYQNRPVYYDEGGDTPVYRVTERKGTAILQYQFTLR